MLGGIDVDLKEYVDDIDSGDVYVGQGKSKLNSTQAKAVLNSKDFAGGLSVISSNQRQICSGLLKAALFNTSLNLAVAIDALAGDFKTDLDVNQIISFISNNKNLSEKNIMDAEVPGYKTIRNNNMVFMIDVLEWKKLRTQISYGSIPATDDDITVQDVEPSKVSVVVQNGAGIDGAGAMLSEKISNLGFNVIGVENADSKNYEETLVIYNGEEHEKEAHALKNSLRNGRCVNGKGLYNMKSDILIIIGLDLKI